MPIPMSYEKIRIQNWLEFVYKTVVSLYTNFFKTHRDISQNSRSLHPKLPYSWKRRPMASLGSAGIPLCILFEPKSRESDEYYVSTRVSNIIGNNILFGTILIKPQIQPNSRRLTQIILFNNSKDAAALQNLVQLSK